MTLPEGMKIEITDMQGQKTTLIYGLSLENSGFVCLC